MKRIFSLIIISLTLSYVVAAQWVWQNPKPTGADLYDVQFLDANVGWFVGTNGTIFRTTNSGVKWLSVPVNPLYDLSRIYALDANNIWVLGVGYGAGELNRSVKILFSSDGGNSWQERLTGASLPDSIRSGFHDINFRTSLLGWSVGDSGLILRTTDGGYSWTQYDTIYNYTLEEVTFLNDSLGFICGGLIAPSLHPSPSTISVSRGIILRTSTGGAQWDTLYSDTITIRKTYFRSSSLGWALGTSLWINRFDEGNTRNYILKTTDGGITWKKTFTGTGAWEEDIFFLDDNRGWAVGPGGEVLSTTDGGELWYSTNPTQRFISRLHGICFSDSTHGYIVGTDGAILQSTDAGQLWTHYEKPLQNLPCN